MLSLELPSENIIYRADRCWPHFELLNSVPPSVGSQLGMFFGYYSTGERMVVACAQRWMIASITPEFYRKRATQKFFAQKRSVLFFANTPSLFSHLIAYLVPCAHVFSESGDLYWFHTFSIYTTFPGPWMRFSYYYVDTAWGNIP